MTVEIREKPIFFNLHGVSGEVQDRNYAAAGFKLMEGLWPIIKEQAIQTTGINYWVYTGPARLSTCVELVDADAADHFEWVPVELRRYAYYKHVGPYERLREAYGAIKRVVDDQLFAESGVAVEKYGHWTDDTSKLETEIFFGLA